MARPVRWMRLLLPIVCAFAVTAVQKLAAEDIHKALAGEWKYIVDDEVIESARRGASNRGSRSDVRNARVGEQYCCSVASYVVKTDRKVASVALQRLREIGHAQVMSKQDDYVLVLFHGAREANVRMQLDGICEDMVLGTECIDVAEYPLSLKIADSLLDIGRLRLSARPRVQGAAPALLLQLNPSISLELPAEDVVLSLQHTLQSTNSYEQLKASYLGRRARDVRVRDGLRQLLLGQRNQSCKFEDLSWGLSRSNKYATVHGFENIECAIAAAARIATSPAVTFVDKELHPVLFNNNIRWVVQSFVEDDIPIWDHGLNGTGQVVGIADTGLDQESCYFKDLDGPVPVKSLGDLSFDNSRRKVIQYVRTDDSDGVDYFEGHGTHVAGIAAGESAGTDAEYNGLAFGAKIAFFDTGKGDSDQLQQPADLSDIFEHAYAAGARVHSDSWGYASSRSNYDSRAQQIDSYMHEHPDMLLIFAAGNQGTENGIYSVAPPASSKNALAVGATKAGTDAKSMMPGSSEGPAPDGRIKPDVVAPGGAIMSASASSVTAGSHSDTCEVNMQSGTSMATPAVAAAALLVREYFESGYYPSTTKIEEDSRTLSNAMLKAILINSGEPLAGTVTFPGNQQGHGRVQLNTVLPFDGTFKLLVEERVCISDEVFTFPLDIRSKHVPISVTLTWIDPPGTSSPTKHIINELDVVAVREEISFFPNGLSASDPLNNVQRIIIPTWSLNVGDAIDVVVSCADVVESPQTFAVAMTGYFDWLNDTYNYTQAGVFQPTPAPTMAPTMAPVPTPAPSPAPEAGDDDAFEFQSFNSWAGSAEGSSIISGGVLVVLVSAILGYRSCLPKYTKDKLAARALARAVAEYRQDEEQFFQRLENLHSPTHATGEPEVYIDRPTSTRPTSTRAPPVSPMSPSSPSLLVLRGDDSDNGDQSRSRRSRRYSTGSTSSRYNDSPSSRRASHRIDMASPHITMTELRDDVDVSRRNHLNYIRDSIY